VPRVPMLFRPGHDRLPPLGATTRETWLWAARFRSNKTQRRNWLSRPNLLYNHAIQVEPSDAARSTPEYRAAPPRLALQSAPDPLTHIYGPASGFAEELNGSLGQRRIQQ
jgi:hypothetical protein